MEIYLFPARSSGGLGGWVAMMDGRKDVRPRGGRGSLKDVGAVAGGGTNRSERKRQSVKCEV